MDFASFPSLADTSQASPWQLWTSGESKGVDGMVGGHPLRFLTGTRGQVTFFGDFETAKRHLLYVEQIYP